jgi:hypothetical protein
MSKADTHRLAMAVTQIMFCITDIIAVLAATNDARHFALDDMEDLTLAHERLGQLLEGLKVQSQKKAPAGTTGA